MSDYVAQHLIGEYLASLRKELVVHGIAGERMHQILLESEAHLSEAVENLGHPDAAAIKAEIVRFGSPTAFAKQVSKQDSRVSGLRAYVWPSGVLLVALLAFRYGGWMTLRFFASSASPAMLFLLALGTVLAVLGYRARKPLGLEFGVIVVALVLLRTLWLGVATYPVTFEGPNIGPWIESVGRFRVNEQANIWRSMIAKEKEVVESVKRGQQVFSPTNTARLVPPSFVFEGKYWVPEGIRESILFGPKDPHILPQQRVATWEEAVVAWSPNTTGLSASYIIEDEPRMVALTANCLRNLEWIQDQSILVRFGLSFRREIKYEAVMVGLVFVATNLGWMVWCFVRWLGQVHRRRIYRPDAWV